MKTATESPRAVLEAMPGRSNMSQAAAAIELENIRARVFFGAFEKYEQPLQNLLAAAKRGSLPNADPVGFLEHLCGLGHAVVCPF